MNTKKKRQNVVREIKLLKQLNDPHIIKLYTTIDTGKQVVLVMEYIGKTSLYQ